ncbi:MAG: restriction endonuclease subunit S [Roseburia hominis]
MLQWQAGSSVQNLNKEKVSKIVLPCPRISEQKSIAEVLSDIDTLIIDLKKLIRKKKIFAKEQCKCL